MRVIFIILIFSSQAFAGKYQDYIEAKKEALEADRDYLEYVESKRRQAAETQKGLEEFQRLRAWREWRYEMSRRRFIRNRDAKERQPAAILEADERVYERELAADIAERERDRRRHVYLREMRHWVRQEIDSNAVAPELKRRNERPWDEF